METSDAEACPQLNPQGSLEQPETARHPDGRPANEAEAFNAPTPDRDDEGKRRRFSFETSRELAAVVAAGADCSSSTGHDSAASTSSRATATSQEEPPPVSQGVDSILRSYLASWGQRLVHLQPKVYMTEHLNECGLHLFKCLRQLQVQACCEGKFPIQYLSNQQLLIHDLVACWWVALKHCSVRTAVPNRTLMCRATSSSPELLVDRELAMLIAIDWEVQAVLKQAGLVL